MQKVAVHEVKAFAIAALILGEYSKIRGGVKSVYSTAESIYGVATGVDMEEKEEDKDLEEYETELRKKARKREKKVKIKENIKLERIGKDVKAIRAEMEKVIIKHADDPELLVATLKSYRKKLNKLINEEPLPEYSELLKVVEEKIAGSEKVQSYKELVRKFEDVAEIKNPKLRIDGYEQVLSDATKMYKKTPKKETADLIEELELIITTEKGAAAPIPEKEADEIREKLGKAIIEHAENPDALMPILKGHKKTLAKLIDKDPRPSYSKLIKRVNRKIDETQDVKRYQGIVANFEEVVDIKDPVMRIRGYEQVLRDTNKLYEKTARKEIADLIQSLELIIQTEKEARVLKLPD